MQEDPRRGPAPCRISTIFNIAPGRSAIAAHSRTRTPSRAFRFVIHRFKTAARGTSRPPAQSGPSAIKEHFTNIVKAGNDFGSGPGPPRLLEAKRRRCPARRANVIVESWWQAGNGDGVHAMPFKRRIADVELKIDVLRETLEAMRKARRNGKTLDKLLGQLARLNADRTRLMMHQLRHDQKPSG